MAVINWGKPTIEIVKLENGAIPMTYTENGEVSVNPYFSDFAALALLDSAEKYSETSPSSRKSCDGSPRP